MVPKAGGLMPIRSKAGLSAFVIPSKGEGSRSHFVIPNGETGSRSIPGGGNVGLEGV